MQGTKLNNIAYKVVTIIICLFLLIGGLGFGLQHLYIKCLIGLLSALFMGVLIFRRASVKHWVLTLLLPCISAFIIGMLK